MQETATYTRKDMDIRLSDKKINIILNAINTILVIPLGVLLIIIGLSETVSILMIGLGCFLIAGSIYSLKILVVKKIVYNQDCVTINGKVVGFNDLLLLTKVKQNWIEHLFWGNFADGSPHGSWNIYEIHYQINNVISKATFVISTRNPKKISEFVKQIRNKNTKCNISI